jgi:hypothetical protein
MKKKVNITLDEEILKKLDKERGLIPLSTYINKILRRVGDERKWNLK